MTQSQPGERAKAESASAYLLAVAVTILQLLLIIGVLWLIHGSKPTGSSVVSGVAIMALLTANRALARKGSA